MQVELHEQLRVDYYFGYTLALVFYFFVSGICSLFNIVAIADLFISFLPVKEKK
jgi:hypothetical protein